MDQLHRPMRDLRISVTDRCNFRCTYCMPKEVFGDDYAFLQKSALLTFEELERLAMIFTDLGVQKIRITGGEPLLRPNIHQLIETLHTIGGVKDIALTTNGLLLKKYAHKLKQAGLQRINISLDALNDDLFGKMNGRGIKPAIILENIQVAQDLGFQMKVNMVVEKNKNEQEIVGMATYFKQRGIPLRFIEFMDVGNNNEWTLDKVVTKREILETLQRHFQLEPVDFDYYGEVAKKYRYTGTDVEVGFITSVSESFCSTCTRLRLSSDGKLYTCLFASTGFDLKALIRDGASDEELNSAIINVWNKRQDRYSDERAMASPKKQSKINMSYIGG